jgi:putative FmdB family regulatory protein
MFITVIVNISAAVFNKFNNICYNLKIREASMPVYEYWCNNCKAKMEVYLPRFESDAPPCPKCKNTSMQRRFSTFMVQKSYKDVYDNILSDAQLMKGMMNNDPKALASWNNKMSGGEPVAPEYQESLERMEHGEMPSVTPPAPLPE